MCVGGGGGGERERGYVRVCVCVYVALGRDAIQIRSPIVVPKATTLKRPAIAEMTTFVRERVAGGLRLYFRSWR